MEVGPPCNLKILSLRETQFVSRRDKIFIAVVTSLNRPEIWIFPCGKEWSVFSCQISDFRKDTKGQKIKRDIGVVSFQSLSRSCRGAWEGARDARAGVARRASSVCSRGLSAAIPPAIYGFFPAGKGVGRFQISVIRGRRVAVGAPAMRGCAPAM